MTSNLNPLMKGLHRVQDALDALDNVENEYREVKWAVDDLKNARSRILDVVSNEARRG